MLAVSTTDINGLESGSLKSEAPPATKSHATLDIIGKNGIGELIDRVSMTAPKLKEKKTVTGIQKLKPPVAIVAVKSQTLEEPARSGMTFGVDDENSSDWVK
tara:strand:- start:20066 stop:20371 length:306 start_codon:yes stop_codon:yes gene_type:complete